jgi:hypothetical protein
MGERYTSAPATHELLPGWLKFANKIVKALHRLGVRPGTIHVLAVPGRVSGVMRSTPVSPLTVVGERYVVSPAPQSDWVRNADAAGWGELTYGRSKHRVRLTRVVDERLKEEVLRAFPREVPQGVGFFVRVGATAGPTPDDFAAAAPKCAVFHLTTER